MKIKKKNFSGYGFYIHTNIQGSFQICITVTLSKSVSARNIPGIFAECSLNVTLFRTSREHLGNIAKENIFKKIINGKVVFILKKYDLTITNADLLANFSNHKAMFPEYSKNIPPISVSKILQGCPPNIVRS